MPILKIVDILICAAFVAVIITPLFFLVGSKAFMLILFLGFIVALFFAMLFAVDRLERNDYK